MLSLLNKAMSLSKRIFETKAIYMDYVGGTAQSALRYFKLSIVFITMHACQRRTRYTTGAHNIDPPAHKRQNDPELLIKYCITAVQQYSVLHNTHRISLYSVKRGFRMAVDGLAVSFANNISGTSTSNKVSNMSASFLPLT